MNPSVAPPRELTGIEATLEQAARRLTGLGPLNELLFAACLLLTPLLTFTPGLQLLNTAAARLAVFTAASLCGGLFLRAAQLRREPTRRGNAACLVAAALAAACAHIAISYIGEVSTYPLTMGWSETSRYYYASLFFAERIYGAPAAPTVLHPSRYLLLALPFLIPGSPLWLHRLWQALLWVAMPAAAALALGRRATSGRRQTGLLIAAAAFGYLMIGPVYYHLAVPLIIVLGGFSTRRSDWLRNAAVVFAASAWAGISRVNWFPVPGLLAAMLIFLERPAEDGTTSQQTTGLPGLGRYLLEPITWTLAGTAAAFLAQVAYIAWSGNAAEQFTTSFASDLLWSRLLPNPTFKPGIFLGIVLVSLPVGLIVAARFLHGARIHALRLLGLAAILGLLLAGGLVVSVKIGGGNNLHNLDAYLALLTVTGAYFASGRAAPESVASIETPQTARAAGRLSALGIGLCILMIALFAVAPRGSGEALPERGLALSGEQTIVEAAEDAAAAGGKVLFLSNRHLLTFGETENVPLEAEYERVFLMEAAMAGDPAYLQRFYDDLKNHRYALIVSEPLSRQQKGAGEVFGAENDAWVKRVAHYVLCYYEPVKTLRAVRVQLLEPRAVPAANCQR